MPQAGQEFILAARRHTHLVLLAARAQDGVQRRQQRQRTHRPLHQAQIAQSRHRLPHLRRVGAAMGQQHDGQVRPVGLARDEFLQQLVAARRQRFLHGQHGAGALLQLLRQFGQGVAHMAADFRRGQHLGGQAGILAGWRVDQDALFHDPSRWRCRPARCRARRRSARRSGCRGSLSAPAPPPARWAGCGSGGWCARARCRVS